MQKEKLTPSQIAYNAALVVTIAIVGAIMPALGFAAPLILGLFELASHRTIRKPMWPQFGYMTLGGIIGYAIHMAMHTYITMPAL